MARVEWTRVAPDDVEHLVAMLLCRENPPGTAAGYVDLAGGLGGVITGGSLTLGPATASAAAQYDLRLRLLDEAGDLLAETLMPMQEPTTGLTGRGVRAHGTEQHEAFDFEILTDLDTGGGDT